MLPNERSADAPACDGHPIPDFAGTNPFIDLLRGKFEVLELLSPFRLLADVLEAASHVHPAKLVRHSVEGIELTDLFQIERPIACLLLQFLYSGRDIVTPGFHSAARKLQALLIAEIAVLLHENDLPVLENRYDQA